MYYVDALIHCLYEMYHLIGCLKRLKNKTNSANSYFQFIAIHDQMDKAEIYKHFPPVCVCLATVERAASKIQTVALNPVFVARKAAPSLKT